MNLEKKLQTWNGKEIVNIKREFLNSNGATKHIDIKAAPVNDFKKDINVNKKLKSELK